MFNPWFLPSLTFENRGLDLMLRTVSDPDVRARSLVCCAPIVRDHYPNDSVQSTTAADKHKGKRPKLRKQQCPKNDRAKRMVHVIVIRRHTPRRPPIVRFRRTCVISDNERTGQRWET